MNYNDDKKPELEYTDWPELYKVVFKHNAVGAKVLDDIKRNIMKTKIDANNISPETAIYKVAQLDVIRRIENLLEEKRK
ncbi:hypothetical protein ABIE65_002042 [Constrictibacter sp. MBR-5]|jgi:hypothetical protein|uniref:hypothetical protein n=1 Tax=Constrictibacter sp. MBR-5 TaxID=3156467 RepID=UPI00339513A7